MIEKNNNLQIAMDALCDVLFVAGAHLQITGVAQEKKQEIKSVLKYFAVQRVPKLSVLGNHYSVTSTVSLK